MQKTLHFKPQILPSKGYFFFNPNSDMEISLHKSLSTPNCSFFLRPIDLSLSNHCILLSLSGRNQAQNSIVCARKNKRWFGSQRSRNFYLKSMLVLASNLNILPEPLNLFIEQFSGGNGGGSGFWKGFEGGGFGGWRRRKSNLGIFGFLIFCGLSLLLVKETENNIVWRVLGFALFGFSFMMLNRGAKDWVLGFCCGVAFVGLGLRREEVQKWVQGSRVCSPVMEIVRRRRKPRRAM